MKIKIISVGKIKEKYLVNGINEYLKRLTPYVKIEINEIPDEKASESLTQTQLNQIKDTEGKKILTKISDDDYVVALAIEGKQKSSEELASFFNQHMIYNGRDIDFIIGGSNGLSEAVIRRSNELLSFSKFTFPHQMMRFILLEQIYRSYKIIKNEPYHK
ncbi:23S rRNA (pseudouridine(1915)-N(3))-methyltransferase RlmH [Mycoplasmatota bacterium]|nr:23S rRNA (pseudouridine(1915)-N(3))-methyltransferase RlmH [Mycoplasmatota bacterium]